MSFFFAANDLLLQVKSAHPLFEPGRVPGRLGSAALLQAGSVYMHRKNPITRFILNEKLI